MKRYFKLIKLDEYFGILNNKYGRYAGKQPHIAARKAFRRVVTNKIQDGQNVENDKYILFCIKECTRNSKKDYIGIKENEHVITALVV